MVIICAFCFFSGKTTSRAAEFIVNGQGVCEDHVGNASPDFQKELSRIVNSERGAPYS